MANTVAGQTKKSSDNHLSKTWLQAVNSPRQIITKNREDLQITMLATFSAESYWTTA